MQISQQTSIRQLSKSLTKLIITKQSKYQFYSQLIIDWYKNYYIDNKPINECYQLFIRQVYTFFKHKIILDNQIGDILIIKSRQKQFLQYSSLYDKQNQLKKTLDLMNQTLKQYNFISNRQYNKFKSQFIPNNLEQSVILLIDMLKQNGFLDKKKRSHNINVRNNNQHINNKNSQQYNQQKANNQQNILINYWSITIIIDMYTFWQFILLNQIENIHIVKLFSVYYQILKNKQKKQQQKQLRYRVKKYLHKLVQNIQKQKEKRKNQKNQQTSILYSNPNINQKHTQINRENQQKFKNQYQNVLKSKLKHLQSALNKKAQQISVYLNKNRWNKFNQQYDTLVQSLKKRFTQPNVKFQTFGSFRSKFFVNKYSDIDIVMIYQSPSLKQRKAKCKLLEKIKQVLDQERQSCIPNYHSTKLFTFAKITVPFIKIMYKNDFGQNLDIISSVDIIINNKEGIENSKLLAEYAQNQYLLKFCNIIKYWAFKKTLINLVQKMLGLSSYGVILMCLYYFMVTQQIPYLKIINGQYNIGCQKFSFKKSLGQNFIGFLKFYSYQLIDSQTRKVYKGQFHQQNHIVCLLKEHKGKDMISQDYIINMYDFIDGTNPGRMKKSLDFKFHQIFQETLYILENGQIDKFQQIFEDKIIIEQKKRVYRGNRYLRMNQQLILKKQ